VCLRQELGDVFAGAVSAGFVVSAVAISYDCCGGAQTGYCR
jgi:hypothetical protein